MIDKLQGFIDKHLHGYSMKVDVEALEINQSAAALLPPQINFLSWNIGAYPYYREDGGRTTGFVQAFCLECKVTETHWY